MSKLEGGPTSNTAQGENPTEKRENRKKKVIAQAALLLAENFVGELVTGSKQYVTEYLQAEIEHKRKIQKKVGNGDVVQKLEEFYDEMADMNPSAEQLAAYYKKREEREAK